MINELKRTLIRAVEQEVSSCVSQSKRAQRNSMLGVVPHMAGFQKAEQDMRKARNLRAGSHIAINLIKEHSEITTELAQRLAVMGFVYTASIARRHALVARSKQGNGHE